jgi:hypothetical protein
MAYIKGVKSDDNPRRPLPAQGEDENPIKAATEWGFARRGLANSLRLCPKGFGKRLSLSNFPRTISSKRVETKRFVQKERLPAHVDRENSSDHSTRHF